HLLRSAPALDPALRRQRFDPLIEAFRPDQPHGQTIMGEAGNRAQLMLAHPAVEIVGVADIKGAARAMEHAGPERHAANRTKGRAFDTLGPNGIGLIHPDRPALFSSRSPSVARQPAPPLTARPLLPYPGPMRLNQVTVGCTDYAASAAFYEALGFTRI